MTTWCVQDTMTTITTTALLLLVAACHQSPTTPSVTPAPVRPGATAVGARVNPAPVDPTPAVTPAGTPTPAVTSTPAVTTGPTAVGAGATAPAPVAVGRPATLVFGTGPVIVRGRLTRELTRHSDNRPLLLAADNRFELELRGYMGEDRPTSLQMHATLTLGPGPLTLPLDYEVRGTGPTGDDKFLLTLEVHSGGADHPLVLMTEYSNEIEPATTRLDVKLTGLEDCDAPEAGGFCN